MMGTQAYVGTSKRTFQQALIRCLETDYNLIGSRRVLALLAEDIQQLVDEFYPAPEHLSSGWMVFTGTKATGPKAYPGQSAGDHELVTLAWPVLWPADIQQLASQPETKPVRRQWFQDRLIRILEYGWHHPKGPVLLTLADLAAMLGLTTVQVSQLLAEARRTSAKPLLTKGLYFDQGLRPTHKSDVIALYEQGVDEVDIARYTGHAPSSVGRYIRDYERVRLLLKKGIPVDHMSRLINMQPGVVRAYVKLTQEYHPDLMPTATLPP